MAHYLQYWSPQRAALAFDAALDGISALENGWFKSLSAGDTLWVLTRAKDELLLVLRSEVAGAPVQLKGHPRYAIRNSRHFRNYRVRFSEGSPPYAIVLSRRALGSLRFYGASERAVGELEDVLIGPLGSMRQLKVESVGPLEKLWALRAGKEWLKISIRRAGEPVFASADHRSRVERSAVRHVSRVLEKRGWRVQSRERDGVGYDLHCTRRGMEWHVEVKGTSGEDPLFFMTHGEHAIASTDKHFRLAIVTSALDVPSLRFHTGPALLRSFAFQPLAFSVAPKR